MYHEIDKVGAARYRATCLICDWFKHRPTETLARESMARHLWHMRHNPEHATKRSNKAIKREQWLDSLPERIRQHNCPSPDKRAHKTLQEAKDHIAELYKTGLGNPDYKVYKCECGYYHVGHNYSHFRNRIKRTTN